MILLIEIGNSRTAVALHSDETLGNRVDWLTGKSCEFSHRLERYILDTGVSLDMLSGVAISSVVPEVTAAIASAVMSVTGLEPFRVEPGINIGMLLHYDKPGDIGSDRVANAVAARRMYDPPFLIIDFGTATTMTLVTADNVIAGGLILPGINLLRKSLGINAAQLSEVPFYPTTQLIETSTTANVQSGIYHLFRFGVEGILRDIEETTEGTLIVIGTGGLCETASREIPRVDHILPDLTLDGVYHLYALNEVSNNDPVIWPRNNSSE